MSVCQVRYQKERFEKAAEFVGAEATQLEILWQINQMSISLSRMVHQQFSEFEADATVQPIHIQSASSYQALMTSERLIHQYLRTLDTRLFALIYASLMIIDDEDASFQKVVTLVHTANDEINNQQLERLYNIFMVYYPAQRDKSLQFLMI